MLNNFSFFTHHTSFQEGVFGSYQPSVNLYYSYLTLLFRHKETKKPLNGCGIYLIIRFK